MTSCAHLTREIHDKLRKEVSHTAVVIILNYLERNIHEDLPAILNILKEMNIDGKICRYHVRSAIDKHRKLNP